MGVRILIDADHEHAVLYCSTTDWAFGPVFREDEYDHAPEDRAELFLEWLSQFGRDARLYTDAELSSKFTDWRMQEATQWAAKDAQVD